MAALLRPLLAFCLAVTLFAATAFDASANLTAEIAAASVPCCEGDCMDDQVCETDCATMMRGGSAFSAWLQAPEPIAVIARAAATLTVQKQILLSGLAPHGLKRPPRT